jgi:hypothetical protein
MRGRSQAVVAGLIACAVMLILVSPSVPSPASTAPTKHKVQSPQVIIPLATLLFTPAVILNPQSEVVLAPPVHLGVSGSDVVDLKTARLC